MKCHSSSEFVLFNHLPHFAWSMQREGANERGGK